MKYQSTKDEFETFSDELKKEYTEKDGVYVLNLEGHEETLIPKAKKDLADQHRKAAEKKLSEAEAREVKLMEDLETAGKSTKEIEAVRRQHQEDLAKVKEEYAEKDRLALEANGKLMIDAEATKFTSDKFTVPSLVANAYAERLSVETVEGQQVIRVRNPDGSPSVQSLADLQKEFLDNPDLSSIVIASHGTGGGANQQGKANGSAGSKTMTRSEFEALSPNDKSSRMADGYELTDDV